MENNKAYIVSEYLDGRLNLAEREEFQLQLLEDIELREVFFEETFLRQELEEAKRINQYQAKEATIKATILASMRKVKVKDENKSVEQVFNPVLLAYLYANLIAYQAIELQKRRFALIQASNKGLQARGVKEDNETDITEEDILKIDEELITKQQELITFQVGTTQNFPIVNIFDEKRYFALVEIANNTATFLYPYHQNIVGFDISNAENFWLAPNEYMPLSVGIEEGVFDVEILYAKEPFHFRPQQPIPIAEYQIWKQTYADKIVFVMDNMRYVGQV